MMAFLMHQAHKGLVNISSNLKYAPDDNILFTFFHFKLLALSYIENRGLSSIFYIY